MSNSLRINSLAKPSNPEFEPHSARVLAPAIVPLRRVRCVVLGQEQHAQEHAHQPVVIVFSKTLGLDETWTSLNLPKTHYYREWDQVVREIMEYSKTQPRGVLLLLDDLISDAGAFNRRNNNLLTELFYCGRHFGISLVITTQKLLAVPSGMLTNCCPIK